VLYCDGSVFVVVIMSSSPFLFSLLVNLLFSLFSGCEANPLSKPYVPFRTDPYDQEGIVHHELDVGRVDPTNGRQSKIFSYLLHSNSRRAFGTGTNNENADANARGGGAGSAASKLTTSHNPMCPLQLGIGVSKRLHGDGMAGRGGGGFNQKLNGAAAADNAVRSQPIIAPIVPSLGPGRQVVVGTVYEHLDLYSPAFFRSTSSYVKEVLVQAPEFPLLMESSSFLATPILTHVPVNEQAHPAVVLADYDGGIYVVGLTTSGHHHHDNNKKKSAAASRRYFHRSQVPRLFVRKEWMQQRVNQELTKLGLPVVEAGGEKDVVDKEVDVDDGKQKKGGGSKPDDPFHTYFEYYYSGGDHQGDGEDGKDILQGVSANLLEQDHQHYQALAKRRARKYENRTMNRRRRRRGDEYYSESYSASEDGGYEDSTDFQDDDYATMDDLERGEIREWKERLGRSKVDDDDYEMGELRHLDDDEVAKAVLDQRRAEKEKTKGGGGGEGKNDAPETMHRRLQEEVSRDQQQQKQHEAPDQQQQQPDDTAAQQGENQQQQQASDQQQQQQQVPDQQQRQPDETAGQQGQNQQQQQAADQQEQQQQGSDPQHRQPDVAGAQQDVNPPQEQQQVADQQQQREGEQNQKQQQEIPDQQQHGNAEKNQQKRQEGLADHHVQDQAQQQQQQQQQQAPDHDHQQNRAHQQQVPGQQEEARQQSQGDEPEKAQDPGQGNAATEEHNEAIQRKDEEGKKGTGQDQQPDVPLGGGDAGAEDSDRAGADTGAAQRRGSGAEGQERRAEDKENWYWEKRF